MNKTLCKYKYDIEEIEDKGSWRKNLAYRPHFLLKMLDRHQEPVLSIDVDATVCSEPRLLLDDPPCDVAFFCYQDGKPCGGTLYFANTEIARKILWAWVGKEKEMPDSRSDEFCLKELFCRKDGVGTFATRLYLPVSYLMTPYYQKIYRDVGTVITHDVVSCNHPNKPEKPPMPGAKKIGQASKLPTKPAKPVRPVKKSIETKLVPKRPQRVATKQKPKQKRKPISAQKRQERKLVSTVSAKERRRQKDRMQPGWAPGKPTRHGKKVPPNKRRGVF